MAVSRFGVALAPTFDLEGHYRLAGLAERAGLDLVGVQDHPYAARFVLRVLAREDRRRPAVASAKRWPAIRAAGNAGSSPVR
jgi:hypothetical protein